jgi:hypothetical protein
MQRYSIIDEKLPREVVLLKSYPCLYGKCSFCNYIEDNSTSIHEIEETNFTVLESITGKYGVIEVLNSGSVFELPDSILQKIKQLTENKNIHTIYFETYYGYRKRLDEIRKYFPKQQIHFRIGIETFDDEFRAQVLNKPFPTDNIKELANQFNACCLLICVAGQTKEQIINDIEIALTNFNVVTINVFIDNGTKVTQAKELSKWFTQEIYPKLKDNPKIEILLDNKDLGVFVQ